MNGGITLRSWKRPSKFFIFITLGILVIGIGGWTSISFLGKADEQAAGTLKDVKSNGDVRVVPNDVLFVHANHEEETLGEIGQMHDYFNKILCWGGWKAYEPDHHRQELEAHREHIEKILVPQTRGTLKSDLERAAKGIEKSLETNDVKDMFITHRIFHDLDVVMNDIVAEDYWGVTETYGKTNP